jgi:hypothetical protein
MIRGRQLLGRIKVADLLRTALDCLHTLIEVGNFSLNRALKLMVCF